MRHSSIQQPPVTTPHPAHAGSAPASQRRNQRKLQATKPNAGDQRVRVRVRVRRRAPWPSRALARGRGAGAAETLRASQQAASLPV